MNDFIATGFAPIISANTKVLVLGSIPGQASLKQSQYYAHPRNTFWSIVYALLSEGVVSANYNERVDLIQRVGIGLWDSVKLCERPGSLDAQIIDSSIVANDFSSLFISAPQIRAVFFNGAKSEAVFKKYVGFGLLESNTVHYQRLPSTSPAHAAMSYLEKRECWKCILNYL